jgi:iron complex transport system substrate-binding protein
MRSTLSRRVCLVPLLALGVRCAQAREITDMAGRTVAIPDKISRIYAAQPYTSVLLYMVAPDLLLGLQPGCLPFGEAEKRYLRPEMAALPVLETQVAGGENVQVNMEAVLAMKPDFALAKGGPKSDLTRIEEKFAKLGLPLVFVDLDRVPDYPAGIDFLGKLLNRETRTARMSAYARRVLAEVEKLVAAIPPAERIGVYYTESADGLATESDKSIHAEAILLAGGEIVHHGEVKTHLGMEKISLEQVLLYNPAVIVSQEPDFAANVAKDPRWKDVKAVASHRIYTIPRTPFNWIDRPPSVMRIMGVQWLAHCFYPDRYPIDIRKEIKDFHKVFMGLELTDADVDQLLK